MMAKDHRQMIQQLQQVADRQSGGAGSFERSGTTTGISGRSGSTSSPNATQTKRESSSDTSGSRTSGASGTANSGISGGATATSDSSRSQGTSQATRRGQSAIGATQGTESGGLGSPGASGSAVQQLIQLDRQIVQRKAQMTREDLQSKQGAEFDKCFVAAAIPAHVHMLAQLEVVEQQGQGQLAQLAQQARPTVQQHLEHAKQLAKQLESQSAVGQAERSSTRTQR
jgi:hypothetical protein